MSEVLDHIQEILKTLLPTKAMQATAGLTVLLASASFLLPETLHTLGVHLGISKALLLHSITPLMITSGGLCILVYQLAYHCKSLLNISLRRSQFGFFWDDYDNPFCPICKETLLRSERIGSDLDAMREKEMNPFSKPKIECVKCDKQHFLVDDDGVDLTLKEAKKKLPRPKYLKHLLE